MEEDRLAGDAAILPVFTLTEPDVISANRFHTLAGYKRLRTYRGWLFAILLYWALIFFTNEPYSLHSALRSFLFAVGGATVLLAVCGVLGQLLLPYRARRLYRQSKLSQQPQRVSFTPEAIQFDGDNFHISHPWADFIRWIENRRFLLLYVNDRAFHVLPARALTEDRRAAIRQALTQAAVRENG